ncbi:hypothetical protein TRFO_12095 [Tritrichomonas foetus]|uniref:Uncharacterized protein n=1 Tax=Tritrichomonas foetus TaxID=1144522 RepID=A0A1J4J0Y5_9EUKA|nr:hypothetical protein TRFO_12095 [Tritrichomonas foetus]|eukprot:OHS93074.1 hypothetical protein TRFO_12095 [Tritrichomonas foetus]
MRSHYMNTFHAHDKKDFAKIAPPPPGGQVIPRDHNIPKLSMAQLGMLETSRAPRDLEASQSARSIANEQRRLNVSFGFDNPNYSTTTASSYTARKPVEQPVSDGWKNRVSIEFDKKAGLGPHEKSLTKRGWAPEKPDTKPVDQHIKNFDEGYDRLDYKTTTNISYQGNKCQPPPRAIAPPCSEFSNHGPFAGPWKTSYSLDFQKRAPIENTINKENLKKTSWDQGYDKVDWPKPEPPLTARRCPKGEDLHQSNVVFRGDGNMQFATTQNQMVGNFDKNTDARLPPSNEARIDHIFAGSDKTSYSTSAKDANRLAGTGKPAQPFYDYSRTRGACYARGGDWDRFAGKEMVDIKKYKYVPPTTRADGSYYRRSHFDLEATTNNKPRYTTTYYKTICKPALEA